jgi:hypothetical protein
MKNRGLITVCLAAVFSCVMARGQNDAAPLSQVTTTDGKTYHNVTVLHTEPDGLLVSYDPTQGGVGLAKLKFRNLPEALRTQYNYDAQAATNYETQQAQATAQWRSQMAVDDAFHRYQALANLNWELGGDQIRYYSVSLDGNGKVTAQGFTGNIPPYPGWCFPYGGLFGLGSGMFQNRGTAGMNVGPNEGGGVMGGYGAH